MMLNEYYKNKKIRIILKLAFVLFVLYAFVEWREQRLERRAKMFDNDELKVNLSEVGSTASTSFLVDSAKEGLSAYIYVTTPVEVPKPKEVTYTGTLAGKKTSTVDIYNKYMLNNPYKYQDWKDVEILISFFNENQKKPFLVDSCKPYNFEVTTKNFDPKYPYSNFGWMHRCNVNFFINGNYKVTVIVIKSNSDFNNLKSNLTIVHMSNGSYRDLFGSVLDNTLELLSIEEWK